MSILNKYNLYIEKYNSIEVLDKKFRIRTGSVNIPFFFKNYLYNSNISHYGFSHTPLMIFYLKKTKLLKYIIISSLIYRSARRYLFYTQVINKIIRFLGLWYKDKLFKEFALFNGLIKSKLNKHEIAYLYYKLKYTIHVYQKINLIYTKLVAYRYLNTIRSIKRILDRELNISIVSNKQYKRNISGILFKFKSLLLKCFETSTIDFTLIKLFSDIKKLPILLLQKKFVPTIFKNEKHYLFSNEHQNSTKEVFNIFLKDYYNVTYKEAINYMVYYNISTWKDLFVFLNSHLDTILLQTGFIRSYKEIIDFIKSHKLKVDSLKVDTPFFSVLPGSIIELPLGKSKLIDRSLISFYLVLNCLRNNKFFSINLYSLFYTNFIHIFYSLESSFFTKQQYLELNYRGKMSKSLLNKTIQLHSVLYSLMQNINILSVINIERVQLLFTIIYSSMSNHFYLYLKTNAFSSFYSKKYNWKKRYRSRKKLMNSYYSKLLRYLNKKYGILFSSFLVNDTVSYWMSDYNKLYFFDPYSYIVKLSHGHYKYPIIKYMNGSLNNSEITLYTKTMLITMLVGNMHVYSNQFNYNIKKNKDRYFIMPLNIEMINDSIIKHYGLESLPSISK